MAHLESFGKMKKSLHVLLKIVAATLSLYLVCVGAIGVIGAWVDGPITTPHGRILGVLCLLIAAGYFLVLVTDDLRKRLAAVVAIWAFSFGLGVIRYHIDETAAFSGIGLSLVPTILLLWKNGRTQRPEANGG